MNNDDSGERAKKTDEMCKYTKNEFWEFTDTSHWKILVEYELKKYRSRVCWLRRRKR